MSRKLLSLTAAASFLGAAAAAEVPRVAVDIAPVHSLVARVMEGVGTPDLIIQSGASPHEYSLRPSEAGALQDADIVIWHGPDLTPWMASAVETLAGDAVRITLMELAETQLLEFREGALFEAHVHGAEGEDHAHGDHDHAHDNHAHDNHAHDDHGHDNHAHDDHGHDDHAHDDHGHGHGHSGHDHDHDHGHEAHAGHDHAHGAYDPHAWLSPANAVAWLNVIAAQLSTADPANAGAYFANAAAARAELDAVVAEVGAILDPVRGGRFIVFHDAYQYFEEAFDFPASGAISLSDASDPSPTRIAEIRDRVAAEEIACVLSEPQFDPGLVATVMEGTAATTAVLDPLGSDLEPGPALYPQMLRNLANVLAGCL